MTKTTSIVLLCLIMVLVLFFGVFAFILDGQPIGVNDYHNAYGLIQKSGMFGDTLQATYTVKLDENVTSDTVIKTLKNRLQNTFGYYSVDISEKDGIITIDLPKSSYAKSTDNESSTSIDNRVLSNITQNGKFEILSLQMTDSVPTYNKSNVVLSAEHLRGVTSRSYVNNGNSFYITQAGLTKEGEQLVKKANLTDGTYYCYALDETITGYYYAYFTNSQFQLYSASAQNSKALSSYIKNGTLGATLTQIETVDVVNENGWIFAAVMGGIALATFVFMAIRYKTLGIAGIMSQLIASVAFVYALAAYISMFNLFAAIGTALAYAFMTFFTIFTFERIRAKAMEKTFTAAVYHGFRSTNIVSLIAHAALLVVGIILWVIPTAVTAPMGTVFVYGALLSFVATFALNRLFVKFVAPFNENVGKATAKK